MLGKCSQCAEYGRLVYRLKFGFEVSEAEGMIKTFDTSQDKDSDRSGAYAVVSKQCAEFIACFFHTECKVKKLSL